MEQGEFEQLDALLHKLRQDQDIMQGLSLLEQGVLVAASDGAKMAPPGGAKVPLLDGGECARRAAWPVRPPAGMPEGRDSHRGRGAAGKNKLVTGKRAGAHTRLDAESRRAA
jgi:hypothetical protein